MPEIKLQLNDPKVFEAVEWYTNRAILFGAAGEAYRVVRLLPKYMVEVPVLDPTLRAKYEDLIVRAKFIALIQLTEGEIIDLIQNNFVLVFDFFLYDIWEKLKGKLIAMPVPEDRDVLKGKIKEALLLNEQILTNESLILDGKKVKGTVKNWLIDYNREMGGEKVSALKLSEYLLTSPNTKTLSEESRKKLEYLLKFYEKLKISSLDFEGIEEPMVFRTNGDLEVFQEGRIEKISKDVEIMKIMKRLEDLEKMEEIKREMAEVRKKYELPSEEQKAIEEEEKDVLKNFGTNFKKLADELFKTAISGKKLNKNRAVVILKILAENGNLEDLLEEKKFNEVMISYFRERGKALELEGFKVNPRAPEYISIFLQHILKDKLGMSEDESGRIGMQLFNLLKKSGKDDKYKGLVYFDLEKKEFRWS